MWDQWGICLMLRNCYEDPLYSFDKPRKNSKKNAYVFGAFCLFWGKNLHLRMNGKCELNGTQHNLLTYVV